MVFPGSCLFDLSCLLEGQPQVLTDVSKNRNTYLHDSLYAGWKTKSRVQSYECQFKLQMVGNGLHFFLP